MFTDTLLSNKTKTPITNPLPPCIVTDYTDGGAYGGYGSTYHSKAQIDDDTLNLITKEGLLIDRQYLTLADEIGKGERYSFLATLFNINFNKMFYISVQ